MDLMVNPPLKEFGSAGCGYLELERRVASRVPAIGGEAVLLFAG
jgi:hypothetical protein